MAIRLYHFINLENGIENLKNKRLRVSANCELNDPFEFNNIDIYKSKNDDIELRCKFLKTLIDIHLRPIFGIICFSKDWHNSTMWSHYADKHKGLCLGFDIDEDLALRVNYTSRRIPLDKNDTIKSVIHKMITHKYSNWSYEKEYRCVAYYSAEHMIKYIQFSKFNEKVKLKEVFIGSKCELEVEDFKKLVGNPLNGIDIFKTRLSDRTFNVIKNRNTKMIYLM